MKKKVAKMKNKIMTIFVIIMMSASLLSGCGKQNDSVQQKSLSELIDFENEKLVYVIEPEWAPPIVQNEKYVFYESYQSKEVEIVRIDKESYKKKVLKKLKLSEDYTEAGLCLLGDRLYFVHEDCTYRCDFNGENMERILTGKDLEEEAKSEWVLNGGLYVYKNQIYLYVRSDYIMRLDPDTKKLKTIIHDEDMLRPYCFYQNSLYYIRCGSTEICRVNLDTLNTERVRGKAYSEYVGDKIRFDAVMAVDDQLYYTFTRNDKDTKLYLYSEDGQDVETYNFGSGTNNFPKGCIYDTSIVGYDYWSKPEKMQLYDIKTGKEKEVDLPADYNESEILIDDVLIYDIPYYSDDDDLRNYYSAFLIP
jgi:hypothetical protein